MQTQKQTGVIGAWFEGRGFGFIHQVVDGNLRSYFTHISQIVSGVPVKGAKCYFSIGTNSKGEIATDVEIQHMGLEALAQNVEVEFGGVK